MTDNVTPTLEQKNSRRGLLALIGAGGAAAVAALLGRRNGAEAAPLYGDSDTNDPAVWGKNTGDGPGVKGEGQEEGVEGTGYNVGVVGHSIDGSGIGVYGSGTPGIEGRGASGTNVGVQGYGKPGVYGICGKRNGAGVKGEGDAPGSMGLYGKNIPTRRALRTKGKVQMDCARKKTLSEMGNTITLPSGVTAASGAAVLAMVQGNPGNDAFIRRAFRIDNRHIRITFNKKPANPVSVAYWVVHTG